MNILVRSFSRNTFISLAAAAMLGMSAYAAEPAREDPAAVAASLEKQAAEYRAAAARHENMGKMHMGGAGSSKMNHEGVVRHCDAIAKSLRTAAEESEALASEYRKEAGK